MLVPQRSGVIAEQPGATGAACQADVLLYGLLRWQGLAAASVVKSNVVLLRDGFLLSFPLFSLCSV